MDYNQAAADLADKQEDAFDAAVDESTQLVIDVFFGTNSVKLPEDTGLSDLMVRINDSLTQLFAEYK